MINSHLCIKEEVIRIIALGSRCLYGLNHLLRSKHLSRSTKIQIYQTLILPIVTYGSETWELGATDCERLLVFERRVLRIIFGPLEINGEWRARYNDELYNLYKQWTIVQKINVQRLRGSHIILGHVYRMEEEASARKCLFSNTCGSRDRGRRKTRWMDVVTDDLTKLRVKSTWKRKAADRDEWRRFLSQVKTLREL